jgi:hypothetical protein
LAGAFFVAAAGFLAVAAGAFFTTFVEVGVDFLATALDTGLDRGLDTGLWDPDFLAGAFLAGAFFDTGFFDTGFFDTAFFTAALVGADLRADADLEPFVVAM